MFHCKRHNSEMKVLHIIKLDRGFISSLVICKIEPNLKKTEVYGKPFYYLLGKIDILYQISCIIYNIFDKFYEISYI